MQSRSSFCFADYAPLTEIKSLLSPIRLSRIIVQNHVPIYKVLGLKSGYKS